MWYLFKIIVHNLIFSFYLPLLQMAFLNNSSVVTTFFQCSAYGLGMYLFLSLSKVRQLVLEHLIKDLPLFFLLFSFGHWYPTFLTVLFVV